MSAALHVLGLALRVALLVLAAYALRRLLAGISAAELRRGLESYGWRHIALGLACTAGSFSTLGLFELLALRYAGRDVARAVPRRAALATAFVAHAFSQSIGFALLTGAGVRMRTYARYGVGLAAVTRVSAFVTATATLGLLATGALALLASSAPLPIGRGTVTLRPAGALLAAIVLAYLAWSAFGRRREYGRGRWLVRRPLFPLAAAQVALSMLDWLLAGTVLFFLLPPALAITYATFLRAYFVAQTVGVASHVPGGVGVFDVVLLALLAQHATSSATGSASFVMTAALAASLVMYRVLYYLVPLGAAIALYVRRELRTRVTPSVAPPLDAYTNPLAASARHVD